MKNTGYSDKWRDQQASEMDVVFKYTGLFIINTTLYFKNKMKTVDLQEAFCIN